MDFEKYKAPRDAEGNYSQEEQNQLFEQFRIDALTATGLLKNPKGNAMYAQAWNQAHQYGIEEVFEHLDMMADMMFDAQGKLQN